jgi:hypothetical protein
MAITIEGNILTDAPVNIPVPAAGQRRLFFNTEDGNKLYYKNELGGFFPVEDEEDCCCIIAENIMSGITCALKGGMITMTEFTAFIAAGMTVTGASTSDGSGGRTCSITIGPPAGA